MCLWNIVNSFSFALVGFRQQVDLRVQVSWNKVTFCLVVLTLIGN